MIIEELAYKVTVRAEDFLSGKKKVEDGAKELGDNVTESFGEVDKATKEAGKGIRDVGSQVKKTADDTKRPFGLISGGFLSSAKAAKEFGNQGKTAFSDMQIGAAKYLGLALSIEGTRRLFTSATSSLVDLGNASSFLDMDPKAVEGWQRGAKSVGASAEAMSNTLMRLKNAKNWAVAPMGAPDEFTQATLQLGAQTGIDIIGAKDPGEMFKRTEEALRKLPKQQAETWSMRLGIEPSMLPSILDNSLDRNQGSYQQKSNVSESMIDKAKQVTAVMEDMDQTIKNLGNDLVLAFGGKVIDAMNEFDSWVTNHKSDIIGFFKEGSDWAKKFADNVGGTANALNILLAIKSPLLAAVISGYRKVDEVNEDADKQGVPVGQLLVDRAKNNASGKSFSSKISTWWDSLLGSNKENAYTAYGAKSDADPVLYHPYGEEPAQHAQSTRRKHSQQFGMDALMNAVMMTESRGNPNAVSPAGAIGPYQIMPDTGRDLGLTPEELRDPVKSRIAATKYMNQLINRYGGDIGLALMAYNGGMGRIDNAIQGKGMPLAQETLQYPGKVADYYQQLQQMAGMQGAAGMQSQTIDNSQSSATHINNVNITTNPQSVDEIAKSIEEQRRRSSMTGAFISGNG